MNRAAFLDRDGVINASFMRGGVSRPPQTLEEVQILPGVPAALAVLKRLELRLIVVTNQPDIARCTQTAAMVDAINQCLGSQVPLDEFRVCPHDSSDNCDCRKPKPGLLLAAAADHDIDLPGSFLIGDRHTDILAGASAGCRTFLVRRSYSKPELCQPDFTVADLSEAAAIVAKLMAPTDQSR